MKQTLILGIGQFGCEVADVYAGTIKQTANTHILAIDTDARTADRITTAPFISMAFPCELHDVLDAVDVNLLKNWFPCDRENDCVEYFETLSMYEGSNQWRMKALLSFYYFLLNTKFARPFFSALDAVITSVQQTDEDPTVELYTIASLAGGTGSGLFFPLIMYLKKYFSQRGISVSNTTTLLALPEICEETLTPEQRIKAKANTYATLQEMHAVAVAAAGTESVSFRIGHPNDEVFGLLYDANTDACPINELYLFRRTPGFRSVSLHARLVSDAITSLLIRKESEKGTASNIIYGGISVSKTIYPIDNILDYLSRKSLLYIANEQWMPLFRKASQAMGRSKRTAQEIAEAIANNITENNDALLWNTQLYLDALSNRIYNIYATDASYQIEELLEAQKNNNKKQKMNRTIPKNDLLQLMQDCCENLLNYYNNGSQLLDQQELMQTLLEDASSGLSIVENFAMEDGKTLPPMQVLVNLCVLYHTLDQSLLQYRNLKKHFWKREDPNDIPDWFLSINKKITADCSYHDIGGYFRFRSVFYGEYSHVGRKYADKHLFLYDLEYVYHRMREFFKAFCIESALTILGKWIEAYDAFFNAMEESLLDFTDTTDMICHSFTTKQGMTYFVGASALEKQWYFEQYKKEVLKDNPPSFDEQLGEFAFTFTSNATTADPAPLLNYIAAELKKSCEHSAFYQETLQKNILDVLLTQDEQHGGERIDFALCRSICSGQAPLLYEVPEHPNAFKLSKAIQNSITINLPQEVFTYLGERADAYNGNSPQTIMEKYIFNAGEYFGEAVFQDELPTNELRVIRKTTGLRLSLLEALNEASKDGIYFKAYQKALMMQAQQVTALWNPHLVCGLTEGSLPRIADDIKDIL